MSQANQAMSFVRGGYLLFCLMEWYSPSITKCILCFQKMLVFYYVMPFESLLLLIPGIL